MSVKASWCCDMAPQRRIAAMAGLEYDLQNFNIVAVSDFNMGYASMFAYGVLVRTVLRVSICSRTNDFCWAKQCHGEQEPQHLQLPADLCIT